MRLKTKRTKLFGEELVLLERERIGDIHQCSRHEHGRWEAAR